MAGRGTHGVRALVKEVKIRPSMKRLDLGPRSAARQGYGFLPPGERNAGSPDYDEGERHNPGHVIPRRRHDRGAGGAGHG